jgi:hypothetical protein
MTAAAPLGLGWTVAALVSLGCAGALHAEVDRFGIKKLYADAPPPANHWEFGGDAHDPRFMEQRIVPASGGWFRPSHPEEMRVEVLSDSSANERTIPTFDVNKVLAKGYLFKPPDSADGKGDFLNIEQTWRFKVVSLGHGSANGGPHVELVPGGYRQTSSTKLAGADRAVPASCEAMSYHFNVYPLTGRVKLEKDSDHTPGYTVNETDPVRYNAVPPFADGREVVEKAVLYRTPAGMKLELYLDLSGRGDRFVKMIEYEDRGQWGPTRGGNAECHCGENVILSMARVAIGYRCDNLQDFQFRDMSVRSIDPAHRLP